MTLIRDLSKNFSDLSEQQIGGILYLILNEENLTNSGLIRKTGLPKETLRRFKSNISSLLQEPKGDEILFRIDARSKLEDLNLRPYKWSLVDYSEPKLEAELRKIRKEYNLEPKREYDQFFATAETSISKAKIMQERGDIKGKRIALLGDDDLISVVLGLLGEEYAELVVFDIDRDVLNVIEKVAESKGLKKIRTEIYDARKEPRPELRSRFDVVVTDPPYTKAGIRLFLERALLFLGPKEGASIYLYYGNSFKSPEKTFQIQDLFSNYNLLIQEKIDRFARYYGAESIGSASSLYLLKTLSSTQVPLEKKITDIYTHQRGHPGEFPFVEHYTFKLYDVPDRIVGSKNLLQEALGKFCEYHGLKVVDTDIVRFSGGGLTFNYTLASSSLTLHTWPEMNALHFVLVTCEPVKKPDRLYSNLCSLFKTDKIEIERIE